MARLSEAEMEQVNAFLREHGARKLPIVSDFPDIQLPPKRKGRYGRSPRRPVPAQDRFDARA